MRVVIGITAGLWLTDNLSRYQRTAVLRFEASWTRGVMPLIALGPFKEMWHWFGETPVGDLTSQHIGLERLLRWKELVIYPVISRACIALKV